MRGRFTAGADRRRRRMVRAPSARAHPPLHDRPPAARDRAGRAARLHALPVRLAARVAGNAGQRAGSAGRRAGATRRLRGAGSGMGKRDPAGARRRLFDRVAGRPVHRRPDRLGAPARRARATRAAAAPAPVRATPIVLLPRRQLRAWTRAERGPPRRGARAVLARAARGRCTLRAHGASFFDELVAGAHLLRTELEDALAELVARGRVHCDSFAGLRALLVPQSKRPSAFARRGRRVALFGIEDAGRWTLTAAPSPCESTQQPRPQPDPDESNTSRAPCCAAMAWCAGACSSARRRGCRRGANCCGSTIGSRRAARSAAAASSRACRANSSRCPKLSAALRQVRKRADDGTVARCPALDPLNLVGIVLPGKQMPRQLGARVVWRDGVALATLVAGQVELAGGVAAGDEHAARKALLREPHVSSTPAVVLPTAT